MPHHGGLLQELEQDLERLVVSAESAQQPMSSQQPMVYGQQPVIYGQSSFAPGAMSMGGPYANNPNMVYQQSQPMYTMRPQATQYPQNYMPSYNSQILQQPGQVVIDSGDGQPAMIFGGSGQGSMMMPGRYQQQQVVGQPGMMMQQPVYSQGPNGQMQVMMPPSQQGYAVMPRSQGQISQLGMQQGVVTNNQQVPQQAYVTNPQYVQQGYSHTPGQGPPQGMGQQSTQQLPQQNYSSFQSPQQNPQQTPQQSYPMTSQVPQQAVQPGYAPASQMNNQQPAQIGSPSPQVNQQVSPQMQQQNYPTGSAAPQQVQQQSYPAASQGLLAGPPPACSMSSASGPTVRSLPSQAPMQMPSNLPLSQPASTLVMCPVFLDPQDTIVTYEPTTHKAHDHHHALKALTHERSNSPEIISAIVGTYLAAKASHEDKHIFGSNGLSGRSRSEVQVYNNLMQKLETLSADYISHHHKSGPPPAWTKAIGPHRRQIFADLYNNNEIVRGFCTEMPGGPLALPELDTWALGKIFTFSSFANKAITRAPNFNAALSTLSQVRTVVLIDDSGSMDSLGHSSWNFSSDRQYGSNRNETRWSQARNILASLTPLVAQHSIHGVDLHFLNRTEFYAGLRTSAAVVSAFNADIPNNGTPTGQRVHDILDAYMCTLRYYRGLKPLNLIVITDGEATDEQVLHWSIEEHVTKNVHRGFPAHQFGIEFVQIGDCEYATRHLEKLEEEVSRHHRKFQRDVVGVTPATRIGGGGMSPEKLLAIAVSGIDARMNGYMRARGVNV